MQVVQVYTRIIPITHTICMEMQVIASIYSHYLNYVSNSEYSIYTLIVQIIQIEYSAYVSNASI